MIPQYRNYIFEFHWLKHFIKNNSSQLDAVLQEHIEKYENILHIIETIVRKYLNIKMEKEFSDEDFVLRKFIYLKPPHTTINIPHIVHYPQLFFDRYFYFTTNMDTIYDSFSLDLIASYEYMIYTINNVEEDIDEDPVEKPVEETP